MIRGLIPPAHGEREGKAAFVGWGAAHLRGWLSCVCVCVFFFFLGPVSYQSGRKSISAKAEMANFCALIPKNLRPKATNINADRKSS